MAAKKEKIIAINNESLESRLWKAADALRGSVEPSEYKHIVLSLIFLKFLSDRFESQREKLIGGGYKDFIEDRDFYIKDNVFFLEDDCTWKELSKTEASELAIKIDEVLNKIENLNPKQLKGALPKNYFSSLKLEKGTLYSLINVIQEIDTEENKDSDIIGRIYEYFLSQFGIAQGKGKGEFYTPKSIVNLIVEMIEPYRGRIYDPCCGSGGMFVQSIKFIEAHQGSRHQVTIYGQEYNEATYKLAKMNMAIRNIYATLYSGNTLKNDLHSKDKFDFIMANPPFGQSDWRKKDELLDDSRWQGYEVPPEGGADYAWILHMVSKLDNNGVAGFILSNSTTSSGNVPLKIRQKLLENDLVEAIINLPQNMFYSTNIGVTLWILNRNKKQRKIKQFNDQSKNYRDRTGEVLFVDLRNHGTIVNKKYQEIAQEKATEIATIFHNWQQINSQETYSNIPEFCYSASLDEIARKNYSLAPSSYIKTKSIYDTMDFDVEMNKLETELSQLLSDDHKVKTELVNIFKEFGYDI